MFDAPEIIKRITDIAQIYGINDKQSEDLEKALEDLENNIFVDGISEEMAGKWEKVLKISKAEGDRLEDRRARIKAKILERLPYSYRVITGKIKGMCDELYGIEISEDRTEMEISALFGGQNQLRILEEMLENCLPLNVIYAIRNEKHRNVEGTIRIFAAVTQKKKRRYVTKEVKE